MPAKLRLATVLLLIAMPTTSAHAGLRSPQVPVSGTALQSFFNTQGQTIDVQHAQQDLQRISVPAGTSFESHSYVGGSANFGSYNAPIASPALYQLMPGAANLGWYTLAAFRSAPQRVIVDIFDANNIVQGVNTYLGADNSDFGFYTQDVGGTFYTQDTRNPAGAAKILAYSATGANAGSTWFAGETSAGPGGDYADIIVLVTLALAPVPTTTTSWSRVKALYR